MQADVSLGFQPRNREDVMAAWRAEQFRVTVFPAPGAVFDYGPWWEELVGSAPDAINDQPKLKVHQAQGDLGNGQLLALQVKVHRIDWLLVPREEEDTAGEFGVLGPFPYALTSFLDLIGRWWPRCPTVTRLGLGGVLIDPVADLKAGYLELGKYLHGVGPDPESSDFLYQINRPRQSRTPIPNLKINRLTKWSVAFLQRTALTVAKDAMTATPVDQRFACRLEFDINSAADFLGTLAADALPLLVTEFSELAQEISREGDIK